MTHGYNGRILKVDLTARRLAVEHRDEAFFRQYVGGRALSLYYLLNEMEAGCDPLGPGNLLVFAPGVLTGAPVSGPGRNGVAAKSPLTGALASAEGGGFFGAELKHAGFDAIVVSGRASSPVYLWIRDGEAELRDAEHLWGMAVGECEDALQAELGDRAVRTAIIGPAGENLVRYAAVVNDRSHFAGRSGVGAVMGSKLLKAIAVRSSRGNNRMAIADPAGVRQLVTWMREHLDLVAGLHDTGTAYGVKSLNAGGGLPSFNFRAGRFEHAEPLNGETMRDTILIRRDTCAACTVRCKRVVEATEPYRISPEYGGPEYESIAALGSCVGVGDPLVVAKTNELCAAYGLDSISTGATIAFAMECFERGLLTEADTGGLALKWGDGPLTVDLVEAIAYRRGFGDRLAEGSARLAESIGEAARPYAMHVKGQELPMHEPRIKHAHGVGFSLSPTGADHVHNLHDTLVRGESRHLDLVRSFDPTLQPMETTVLNEDKMRLYYHIVHYWHFLDCAVVCLFLPYSPQQLVDLVNAVTGWDVDLDEIRRVGERSITLARVFNMREGLTAADDTLPARMFEPLLQDEPVTAVPLQREHFKAAKQAYYRMMGWSEPGGVPTRATLESLGVGWAADQLPVPA